MYFFIFFFFLIETPVCRLCRPWSEAACGGILSGSALFVKVPIMGKLKRKYCIYSNKRHGGVAQF